MNVNQMTFGCEIECYVPVETIERVGNYRSKGIQVPGLPQGWGAKADASLRSIPRGYMAVEIISPILSGADGLRQVVFVCQWLNERNARINECCGFHVHVGVSLEDKFLRKIACTTAKHEKALYASTGTKGREENILCKPIRNNSNYKMEMLNEDRFVLAQMDRYFSLNLTNILGGDKPTAEFRVFAGTTNAVKAVSYIRMCVAIVEKAQAMKQLPKWTAKQPKASSPMRRKGGEGSSEVNRFFYYMGWTRGQQEHVYGNIQGDGIATMEESKKELMRLAAKYDAR